MASTKLPAPNLDDQFSVARAIQQRRSRRRFRDDPLNLAQLGQLLWCAQGITGHRGHRKAVPSAGATCPIEVFVAVGEQTVEGLEAGVHKYVPDGHALEMASSGDVRGALGEAALGQDFLVDAPVDILMAADYARTEKRYGSRARRYVDMEAGHISQNIYLQAEALGLGTVAVGAFDDEAVARVFGLPTALVALYIMPVGYVR